MEGERGVYLLGGQWKEKEKFLYLVANGRRRKMFFFTFSHFPSKQFYLDPHFLSFDIKVLLYHGPRPLFMSQAPPTFIANLILLKIFPFFLEIMVLCMVTSYGPQAAQAMKNHLWSYL
jgi:hypothetical protein